MPDPQPVRPRRKDENAYYRALRRVFLAPLLSEIRSGVTEAASASLALDEINNVRWDRGQQYCLLYTSPSPRDRTRSRMPSSA